jgi:hypothetical protein
MQDEHRDVNGPCGLEQRDDRLATEQGCKVDVDLLGDPLPIQTGLYLWYALGGDVYGGWRQWFGRTCEAEAAFDDAALPVEPCFGLLDAIF